MIRKCYELPVPSTDLIGDVTMDHRGDRVILRFSYDRDGTIYRGALRFNKPTAVKHRAERCCTAEQIESSYDTLVEITGSDWVRDVCADMPEDLREIPETHHYRMYLDSEGCYEVMADSWSALPEEQGRWSTF